jgi:hypothetical protein
MLKGQNVPTRVGFLLFLRHFLQQQLSNALGAFSHQADSGFRGHGASKEEAVDETSIRFRKPTLPASM